jgi:hypothetical protein
MTDQRRLRFSDISGLERSDLPLACEIWLEDIYRAPWITREVMKLAAYFMRYMLRPEANALSLREIESQAQIGAEEVRKSLVLMKNFGAVEGFLIDRNDIRVGLCLGYLQRLRALEAKYKFAQHLGLLMDGKSWPWSNGDDKWVPGKPAAPSPVAANAPPASTQSQNTNGGNVELPPLQIVSKPQTEIAFDPVLQG